MRKSYIDNLRNMAILLLFPVHTFMIWNDFGSKFYIWCGENRILSTLIVLVNPWFMPLLFVLAGMSARYALEKRTAKEFLIQRVHKLLIPFVGGMLFFVPLQSLYARKFFNNYEGGLFAHWKYFFTHLTDFSGYDGAFTPGHLWFILFLFLISLVTLPLFCRVPADGVVAKVEKLPVICVLLLFVPIWIFYYIGNFGGFSLGKNLALYLAGYYVLSNERVLEKLRENTARLTGLCVVVTLVSVSLYYQFAYYGDLWMNFVGWLTILTLLVLGEKFLNRQTGFTVYFNRASYPVYILHQSILVALAYYVVEMCGWMPAQLVVIGGGSFGLTVLLYEVMRRVPYVRKLIGIR